VKFPLLINRLQNVVRNGCDCFASLPYVALLFYPVVEQSLVTICGSKRVRALVLLGFVQLRGANNAHLL
jgi:hypothetical protein